MNLHFHKLFLQFITYYICSKHFTEYIIIEFLYIFHQTEVQTVIWRCWINLNSNWRKSYNTKCNLVIFLFVTMIKRHPLVQKSTIAFKYLWEPLSHPVKLKFSDERFSFNFADSVIKKKSWMSLNNSRAVTHS